MTMPSSKDLKMPPLAFGKAKGSQSIHQERKVKFKWAQKGSYRVNHILGYIYRLLTIPVACAPLKQVIFMLDNQYAHLPPEIELDLFQKVYFVTRIGGSVTGNAWVIDTSYHKDSKSAYKKKEMKLILDRLTENPNEITLP